MGASQFHCRQSKRRRLEFIRFSDDRKPSSRKHDRAQCRGQPGRGIFFRGVVLYSGAQNNLVGGSSPGTANLIAANVQDGIAVLDDTTTGNTFQRNSIFQNGAYGIQLATATPPQVAPALASAQAGLATTVTGSLTSAASSNFRIEFYATPTGDASFTAGRYFLGEAMTTTNSGGLANFSVSLGARIPTGYLVTVTATNAAGSTSEFSNTASVQAAVSTVGDGIPDAWKSLYGFSLSDPMVAGRDIDGTGMTNLQKFKAGLNPLDAHSFLRVTSVARSGNDFSITFPSVSGIICRCGAPRRFWFKCLDPGGAHRSDPGHRLANRRSLRSAGRAAAAGILSRHGAAVSRPGPKRKRRHGNGSGRRDGLKIPLVQIPSRRRRDSARRNP